MGKAQDTFNKAVRYYEDSITLIQNLAEAYKVASSRNGTSFSVETVLRQYDIILQAILLQEALADGVFDRNEQQFIDKITDYGDLMVYIKHKTDGQLDLTWTQVASLPPKTREDLVEVMPVLLDDICDQFVSPLAIVDKAITDINFFEELSHYMLGISKQLSIIDNHRDPREATAFADAMMTLILDRWKTIKNR